MKKLLSPLLIVGSVVLSVPVMGASKAPDDKKESKEEMKMAAVPSTGEGQKSEVEIEGLNARAAALFAAVAGDKKNPAAMRELGNHLLNGIDVDKDEKEAVRWFQEAAAGGDVDAMNTLACCWSNGRGCTKNKARAIEYFRAAASEGSAQAMCNLGLCYLKGYGVEDNVDQARAWYAKAFRAFQAEAEKGNAWSMYHLGKYYEAGFGGVTKDQDRAGALFAQAIKAGFLPTEANTLNFNVSSELGNIIEIAY
jgi:TPR repeat protein